MRHFILLLSFFILCTQAWAKEVITVELSSGKTLDVAAYEYLNHHGQTEMRFESDNSARIILGFARDLDDDGLVETFFIFGDGGLERYDRDVPSEDSSGRAYSVLSKHAKYSGASYFEGIATRILTTFFIAVDQINEAYKQWYQDWMDIEEFSIKLEKHKAELSPEELAYGYNLMLAMGRHSLKNLQTALTKEYPAWWAADTALTVSGMALAEWAAKAAGILGKRILPRLEKLGARAAARLGIKLTLSAYRAQVQAAIKAITMRGVLNKSGNLLVKGLTNIKAEWKFIAISTGIQVGVETFANLNDVYDSDPKTMAQNLLNDPSVRENIAISVMDYIAMTAADGAAQTRIGKFALLGIIGASSSLGIGIGINGSQSEERVAFDAAWSVGIDAGQFMLNMHVLHKFESMALKMKNPKLKLVGWAVVFISEAAAYYAYNRATDYFDSEDEKSKGFYRLMPVTVADQ